RQLLARAAPGRPEVDEDQCAARCVYDVLGEARRGAVRDHALRPRRHPAGFQSSQIHSVTPRVLQIGRDVRSRQPSWQYGSLLSNMRDYFGNSAWLAPTSNKISPAKARNTSDVWSRW